MHVWMGYLNTPMKDQIIFLCQQSVAHKMQWRASHICKLVKIKTPRIWDLHQQQLKKQFLKTLNRMMTWLILLYQRHLSLQTHWHTIGTSHQGGNSSCQQQPFTYLSSQYIPLVSVHFTLGIFVRPFLFSDCVCVCACTLCAVTYPVHSCMCKWKAQQYLHQCLPPPPWEPGVCVGLWRFHNMRASLWRAASVNPLIICYNNSHLLDLAGESIPQCLL